MYNAYYPEYNSKTGRLSNLFLQVKPVPPPLPTTTTLVPFESRKFLIFHCYLLCGYYALFIPFKPVRGKDGLRRLKINTLQWILCVFGMWALIWTFFTTELIMTLTGFLRLDELKAKHYFSLAYNSLHFVKQLMFFWILNLKQKQIEDLLNKLSSFSHPLFEYKFTTGYIIIMHVGFLIICILNFIFFGAKFGHLVNPEDQLDAAIITGRNRFFFGVNMTDCPYKPVDIAFGVVELVLELAKTLNDYFIGVFFYGTLPFTFWSAAKSLQALILSLSNQMKVESGQELILTDYEKLKTLTDSINSIYSTMTIIWVVERSIRMIIRINEAVNSKSIYIAHVTLNTLFLAIALVLMAEGCRIVACFREWVLTRKVRETIFSSKHELKMLVRELDSSPIGIGSTGFYQINYGFIAQLLVFTVTLFLISFE